MITPLPSPLPLITPKGKGLAYYLIDYGLDHELHWVVFLDSNCECWTFKNREIRIQKNITQGRTYISPFYDPDSVKLPSTIKDQNREICEDCSQKKDSCVCNVLSIRRYF